MRKSSITLQHHKEVAVHYFYHNSREKPTANSIFNLDNNFTNKNAKQAIKYFWSEFNKRAKKYKERTGKKLPKNTIKHISGIFNIDENTKEEDIKKVIEYLEKNLDTKVVQYSIHKDEGYIDEEGKKHINYHVHLEMLGLDSEGRSVRKKITRNFLRKLQTDVANILKMERGQDVRKTKRKRLDTYEYKRHIKLMNEETKQLKEKIKELEKENSILKNENKILKDENINLKEELKKFKDKLKTLRNILILINKELKLYTKEDYQKIKEIKQELKKENIKVINKIDENIDKLVEYYINKIEEQYKINEELYIYIKQLENLKTKHKGPKLK
jgi:hypothetical protein